MKETMKEGETGRLGAAERDSRERRTRRTSTAEKYRANLSYQYEKDLHLSFLLEV